MVSQSRMSEPSELIDLRFKAKRLSKEQGIKLSRAYHVLAISLGYKTWISLLTDKGWNN